MGLNAKTGEIYNLSTDNEGGAITRKGVLEDGNAILELLFVTGKGQKGGKFGIKCGDTMVVDIEGEPMCIVFALIRQQQD